MNQVFLSGNVTRDVEIKVGQSGKEYCTFSIAENVKRPDGTQNTYFHDVKAFGYAVKVLKKGDYVMISGQLRTEIYEKDGEKKKSFFVIADKIFQEQKLEKKIDNSNELFL